jgi:2-polyprenyl-6-hydroxyphenyl methylase/3-demethylubiquinone-9 3-methyltransferase
LTASEYDWTRLSEQESHAYLAPIIEGWLREASPRRVLDLGCGDGSLTARLAAAGSWTIDGVDFSTSGIARAQERYPDLAFRVHDIAKPLGTSDYDVVVSAEVIEHLLLPRALFHRATEALRPGGLLILTTPFHGYLKNVALAVTNSFDKHWHVHEDYGHVKFFSVASLTAMATECGFVVNAVHRVGRVPVLAKSMAVRMNRRSG